MKRNKLNFIVDSVGLFGFMLMTTTGVLMRYLLPPGSGHSSTIWGFDRHEWGDVHFWVSVVFFSILAFHLFLHWRWIVSVVTGRPREGSGFRVGLGLIGLVAALSLSIAPLFTPVDQSSTDREAFQFSNHQYENISIQGSMTLKEVEIITGVPAAFILKSLNLPESTRLDERLGPLKRQYGFEMNNVREIIKSYKANQ